MKNKTKARRHMNVIKVGEIEVMSYDEPEKTFRQISKFMEKHQLKGRIEVIHTNPFCD